ncbi:MAG: threonylcarbamoyl-AMP synthase [Chloroflexaceae bacterium]|nr:threonylcarbamoyl-AMP synthase [Chloroflexaceae bacterium]
MSASVLSILSIEAPEAISLALERLQEGLPIGFPTDTVYGIGALALNASAVEQLYVLKERPRQMALPVLLADMTDLYQVVRDMPPVAADLARRFWPGALTLVVPAAHHLPPVLLAGGETVAVRIPDHPWLRQLIRRLGQPLAATSANRHGARDATTSDEVAAQFGNRLSLILDGGVAPGGVPSTVVRCIGPHPQVLRPGGVVLGESLARSGC